jgi:Enoyl-CoA hydratase/isomerase
MFVQSSYHLRFQRFLLLDWIVRRRFHFKSHSYGLNLHFCGSSTVLEASVLLGGGDSSADSSTKDNARAFLQNRKTILALQHAVAAPERAPFPVIAAVHGHVIGLGVDLISACDIRYAASNSVFSVKVGGDNHFVKFFNLGI